MRQSELATNKTSSARYAAGTRVDVHRSRFEVERVLGRYGATDFAFVEDDANASIQFAIHGRYVQVALPLPDPDSLHFTHTPSGKPRTVVGRERAYEQALRENWRAFVLVLRGKFESVESGISTFDDEFAKFLLPAFADEHERKSPRAVGWILRSSHSLAFVLVAAALLPASAVTAFALPPSVVESMSAPFRDQPDVLGLARFEALPVTSGRALEESPASSYSGDTQGLSPVSGGLTSAPSSHAGAGKRAAAGKTHSSGKNGGNAHAASGASDAGQASGDGQAGGGEAGGQHTNNGNHYGQDKSKDNAGTANTGGGGNGNHNGADKGKKSGSDAGAGSAGGSSASAGNPNGNPGNGSGGSSGEKKNSSGGKKGGSAPSSGP